MERYTLIAFSLLLVELHTVVQARTLQLNDGGPREATVGASSGQGVIKVIHQLQQSLVKKSLLIGPFEI